MNGFHRYQDIAAVLSEEIGAGVYPVDSKLPSETELQERFSTSRYSIREALKLLKVSGQISSHSGVGTVVKSAFPIASKRFMQSSATLLDLVQSVEATQMRLHAQRPFRCSAEWANALAFREGDELIELTISRHKPDNPIPVGHISLYLQSRHVPVVRHIDGSSEPLHLKIERLAQVQLARVRQQICADTVSAEVASMMSAKEACPCLKITRQFIDDHGHTVFSTIGIYPRDRFAHNTEFLILRPDA